MTETMTGQGMWSFGPFAMLILMLLIIVPFWSIFSKAGYPKWLSLLMVVPLINLALLYIVAFSNWPKLQDRSR